MSYDRQRNCAHARHGRLASSFRLRHEPLECRLMLTTFTVNNLDSMGPDSLADAIAKANLSPGVDTIKFKETTHGGLIDVSTLNITDSLIIDGPVDDRITLRSTNASRTFDIDNNASSLIDVFIGGIDIVKSPSGNPTSLDGGVIHNTENLELNQVTISGGMTTGEGGAIDHQFGRLELNRVHIEDNQSANRGGGISSIGGDVVIRRSLITENQGRTSDSGSSGGNHAGGGIYIGGNADLTIIDSVVSNNIGHGDGGGIFINGGNLEVRRSRIEENRVLGSAADGGGLFAFGTHSSFENSSMTDNYSGDDGNVYIRGGFANLTQVTISGNEVADDGGGILANDRAEVTIAHSTIVRNAVNVDAVGSGAGGGIFAAADVDILVDHTIVAENTDGPNLHDIAIIDSFDISNSLIGVAENSTYNDLGNNIVGSTGQPVDPKLGPLSLNPSVSRFHGLLSGSPAIDAGDPNASGAPAQDQRGNVFIRTRETMDIGSIEYQTFAWTVDTIADEFDYNFQPGDLSLREALFLTGGAEVDIVNFASNLENQSIVLTRGELMVDGSVHILGRIGSRVTIDGNGQGRVFRVDDGSATFASEVKIDSLTITGGFVQDFVTIPGEDGLGGGIWSQENLEVVSSALESNRADRGGGIMAEGIGSLTMTNSNVFNNEADGDNDGGGGIAARTTGDVVLDNVFVENNRAMGIGGNGGGLLVEVSAGTLTTHQTTIADNTAANSGGGALAITTGGTIRFEESTIDNNAAEERGGGLSVLGNSAAVQIIESTISDNVARGTSTNFGTGVGGGLHATTIASGMVMVSNSTISGNASESDGGGVHVTYDSRIEIASSTVTENFADSNSDGDGTAGGLYLSGGSAATLDSTIIAGNFALTDIEEDIQVGSHPAFGPATMVADYSMIGDFRGTGLGPANPIPNANGNIIGGNFATPFDPKLGPLVNNGGHTRTHMLLGDSLGRNSGNPSGPQSLVGSFDQRGAPFDRVINGRVDMGAIESPPLFGSGDFDDDGLLSGSDIDILQGQIVVGGSNLAFDLTNDGIVDLSDRNQWLVIAGAANLPSGNPYLLGDGNLDGAVDASDFNLWNSNKFTNTSNWTDGDFNSDGVVDASDFNIWNGHKFTSSDTTGDDESDEESRRNQIVEWIFSDIVFLR